MSTRFGKVSYAAPRFLWPFLLGQLVPHSIDTRILRVITERRYNVVIDFSHKTCIPLAPPGENNTYHQVTYVFCATWQKLSWQDILRRPAGCWRQHIKCCEKSPLSRGFFPTLKMDDFRRYVGKVAKLRVFCAKHENRTNVCNDEKTWQRLILVPLCTPWKNDEFWQLCYTEVIAPNYA